MIEKHDKETGQMIVALSVIKLNGYTAEHIYMYDDTKQSASYLCVTGEHDHNWIKLLLLILTVMCATVSAKVDNDEFPNLNRLQMGKYFQYLGTFNIFTSKWHHVFDIDMEAQRLPKFPSYPKCPSDNINQTSCKEVFVFINIMTLFQDIVGDAINKTLKQLNYAIPTIDSISWSKKKRGLINFGGTILHYLFGVASDDDVQSLQTE